MPTSYSTTARNDMLNALATLLNGGTIELQTAAGAVLGSAALPNPAFAAAANGVITANAIPAISITVAGTVAKGVLKSSTDAVVATSDATVSAGAGPLKLSRLDYLVGESVTTSSLTYTQPAEG